MASLISQATAVLGIWLASTVAVKAPGGRQVDNSTQFRYLTNKTEPFFVSSLPDISFDLGEFYSGSIAINESNPNRTLFFAFKPAISGPSDSITIWLNGGPGCSSLDGFLEENGPWVWRPGTDGPVQNEYTWANLTNMLWVEQPVGVGFSQGDPSTVTNEEELAQEFIQFFKNWAQMFGIEDYEIYVTGESYGGRYIPYISSAMLNANDKTYYNLMGNIIYDPLIGWEYLQQNSGIMPLVDNLRSLLNLTDEQYSSLNQSDAGCWLPYREKYLTFPPPGHQPVIYGYTADCDIADTFYYQYAPSNNPCFNIYEVTQQCPTPTDPLGYTSSNAAGPYFNRSDVKAALHAPANIDWRECVSDVLFPDNSEYSIISVLPQVIESTNRVLIGNGDYDGIIPTIGTLLAIQNMTWNGKLGLQTKPSQVFNVSTADSSSVPAGIQLFDRGLMWTETYESGHQEPQYQPAVSYRHLQWLLGLTDTL